MKYNVKEMQMKIYKYINVYDIQVRTGKIYNIA